MFAFCFLPPQMFSRSPLPRRDAGRVINEYEARTGEATTQARLLTSVDYACLHPCYDVCLCACTYGPCLPPRIGNVCLRACTFRSCLPVPMSQCLPKCLHLWTVPAPTHWKWVPTCLYLWSLPASAHVSMCAYVPAPKDHDCMQPWATFTYMPTPRKLACLYPCFDVCLHAYMHPWATCAYGSCLPVSVFQCVPMWLYLWSMPACTHEQYVPAPMSHVCLLPRTTQLSVTASINYVRLHPCKMRKPVPIYHACLRRACVGFSKLTFSIQFMGAILQFE